MIMCTVLLLSAQFLLSGLFIVYYHQALLYVKLCGIVFLDSTVQLSL